MGFLSGLLGIVKKVSPGGVLDLGAKVLGFNNDSVFGGNTAAQEAAAASAKAAADAQQQALTLQQQTDATAASEKAALAALQTNSAALSDANVSNTDGIVSNIVAGGTADAVDSTKKKKALPTPGIASALGINL